MGTQHGARCGGSILHNVTNVESTLMKQAENKSLQTARFEGLEKNVSYKEY